MNKATFLFLISLLCLCCSKPSKLNTEVPNITGKLLNGDSINLRTIAQNKITVVNVWGIFCLPCMQELPILHHVYDKYKNNKDFSLITVAMDSETEFSRFLYSSDTTDPYRKMFKISGLDTFYLPTLACLPHGYSIFLYNSFAIIEDSTECRAIQKMINSIAVPTTLIYDQKGKFIFKQIGSFDNDTLLTQKIDSLLAVSKG